MLQHSPWTRLGLLTLTLWANAAYPCSTFRFTDQVGTSYFGRNMDYPTGIGFVSLNQRGRAKRALINAGSGQTPAQWRADFASVTFSQFGRELPYGGMNERGLVVEVMILHDTQYPTPPLAHPAVNEAAFVQYLLDTQDSASGAVAAARQVAIAPLLVKLHYLVCDAGGTCAALEYLNGALVVHTGKDLPIPGMTNSPYANSVASLSSYEGFGGHLPIPTGAASLERFARVARDVRHAQGQADGAGTAWRLLDDVKAPTTQWQVVYDQTHRSLSFRTKAMGQITTIALEALNGTCGLAFLSQDMDGAVHVPARTWFAEVPADRRALSLKTLDALQVEVPSALLDATVNFPEHTNCPGDGLPKKPGK